MSFEGLKVITLISRDYHVIWNIKFTLNLIPTIYRVKSTLQIIYQKKKKVPYKYYIQNSTAWPESMRQRPRAFQGTT